MTDPALNIRLVSGDQAWPLHSVLNTRIIETQCKLALPEHTLMERAGLATARLTLALAPHAQTIWIACGPDDNGGDGIEAAIHLKGWGKHVVVTFMQNHESPSRDAQLAWERGQKAGIAFTQDPPQTFDFVIDALLGVGVNRAPEGVMSEWLDLIQISKAPVLCIDLPSGLCADTGEWLRTNKHDLHAQSRHTLSLLTLKPGLFTADGRDAAGQVWFDNLASISTNSNPSPVAYLQASASYDTPRRYNSHKGSFGKLTVVGGASGMTGAAALAGLAALHAGAGSVYLGLLDAKSRYSVAAQYPALMVGDVSSVEHHKETVVCGCGAGDKVRDALPMILSTAKQLVLDADALNVIANDTVLLQLLKDRTLKARATVLTPHPLEAARLLKRTTQDIQNNRLYWAQELAALTGAVIVLKGSGTVITKTCTTPVINPTGNAALATAGTGDVLAGVIGGKIAQGQDAFQAACDGARIHGPIADTWPKTSSTLDAALLASAVR